MNLSIEGPHGGPATKGGMELPIDMQFNAGHVMSIVVYSILFCLSATGNLTVFVVLIKRRRARLSFSAMDFMLLNLAIADLMVTFLMMPMEVAWAATVYWVGGDVLCRVMAFFRIFGLFLSSFVLVCLAVDRYMAIKFPMKAFNGLKRSHKMITISWILSAVCSLPQVVVFQVERHPDFEWYTQCGTFTSLPSKIHLFTYFLFGMLFTYLGPFIIILFLYCGIVLELIKIDRESKKSNEGEGLRRSNIAVLGKAKGKALKMSLIIALIFFVCWTPYYVLSLWFFVDEDSFRKLDPRINKALFFFACTNSTANPIVYGIFHLMKSPFESDNRRNQQLTLRREHSGVSTSTGTFHASLHHSHSQDTSNFIRRDNHLHRSWYGNSQNLVFHHPNPHSLKGNGKVLGGLLNPSSEKCANANVVVQKSIVSNV